MWHRPAQICGWSDREAGDDSRKSGWQQRPKAEALDLVWKIITALRRAVFVLKTHW
jgi:hypothetical protein